MAVLGTPTEDDWPRWKELPDSAKIVFEQRNGVRQWLDIGKSP
jgi:hypothetical protein